MEDVGDPDEVVARADVVLEKVAREGVDPGVQAVFGDVLPGDLDGAGEIEDRGRSSGLAWTKVMA